MEHMTPTEKKSEPLPIRGLAEVAPPTEHAPESSLDEIAARVKAFMANHERYPYAETPASEALCRWAARYQYGIRGKYLYPVHGLALWGGVGTGKSTALRCLASIFHWAVWPISSLSSIHARHGDVGMWDIFEDNRSREIVIDDLGAESLNKHYGATLPMAEFICARYDGWQERGIRTHFTGNLTRELREATYGSRVSDRIEEMTISVACTWPSFRKRGGTP